MAGFCQRQRTGARLSGCRCKRSKQNCAQSQVRRSRTALTACADTFSGGSLIASCDTGRANKHDAQCSRCMPEMSHLYGSYRTDLPEQVTPDRTG